MAIKIGYMGTKKFLAPQVERVIRNCAQGPVLDVFGGMGAVGEALADTRPVWINDVQIFAAEVGHALFSSNKDAFSGDFLKEQLSAPYAQNRTKLRQRFSELLVAEKRALECGSLTMLIEANSAIVNRTSSQYVCRERARLSKHRPNPPYRLFSLNYSGRFFSLAQAIEVDSLRYAIDCYCYEKKNAETKRWLLIALGVTLLRISASTGHFAQYLDVKKNNLKFVLMQKRRSVFDVFLTEFSNLSPVGSKSWRKKNRAFNCEAIALLRKMWLFNDRPAVVYADPPYTDDQYSRYYHLWETLFLYDYPESIGKGCYRPDRFQTPFAKKTAVESAVNELAKAVSRLDADLVLSYPANGLLFSVASSIESILLKHFRACEKSLEIDHSHSTMGASNGDAKRIVKEMIFVARN